jgi:hypothetical protein
MDRVGVTKLAEVGGSIAGFVDQEPASGLPDSIVWVCFPVPDFSRTSF